MGKGLPNDEEREDTLSLAAQTSATTKTAYFTPVPSQLEQAQLETGVLALWEKDATFRALQTKNKGNEPFSFMDGPITANVEGLGVHHAWGRTYKDLFQRYKAMNGFDQRYQNGFDCQGLWVEVQVEKELKLKNKKEVEAYGQAEFSAACRARVDRSAAAITANSIRLGQWMDWKNSYYTYDDSNIDSIWKVLKICDDRGWLYKGRLVLSWCARCGTSLSQHEMANSHKEVTHTSAYVRFAVKDRANCFLLAWTTTPWTLPANVALAVAPEAEYLELTAPGGEVLIVAKGREQEVLGKEAASYPRLVLKGSELVGLTYEGFYDFLPAVAEQKLTHTVVAWKEVVPTEGTGIVHIAPGCGTDDFKLGQQLGLGLIAPIDESACYYKGFGFLTGKDARTVAQEVLADLKARGQLQRTQKVNHRYPHCWRCQEEIVYRADESYFLKMDELRPLMLEAIKGVAWVPESTGKMMLDWLHNMGDWNIARKRYWGLPLPFYVCGTCDHFFVVGSRNELEHIALRGLEQLTELHRPGIDAVVVPCPVCPGEARRVPEVGDCWLDAGVVPFSTLDYDYDKYFWEHWFPADMVVEMREQVRLWFYSQLFFSVVLTGKAPYKTVLAYEKLLDAQGNELHKTGPNFIEFSTVVEKTGADPLRWMFTKQNVSENIRFGYEPLEQVRRRLLTLWNSYSFFVTYANAAGFDPRYARIAAVTEGAVENAALLEDADLFAPLRKEAGNEVNPALLNGVLPADLDWDGVTRLATGWQQSQKPRSADNGDAYPYRPVAERPLLDRWISSRLNRLVLESKEALDRYDAQAYTIGCEKFLEELSDWYIRRSRSRFQTPVWSEDKSSALHTLYEVLVTLVRVLAPNVPFLTEAIYQNLVRQAVPTAPNSVHLTDWPQVDNAALDVDLEEAMRLARHTVERGRAARSAGKTKTRTPLSALHVVLDSKKSAALRENRELLALVKEELNVRQVLFTETVAAFADVAQKPDLKKLTQKMPEAMAEFMTALRQTPSLAVDGTLHVGRFVVEKDDLLTHIQAHPGYQVSADAGLTVVLETTVTPELLQEGLAREISRKLNELRKEAGLQVVDRVQLAYHGDEEVQRVFDTYEKQIAADAGLESVARRENDTEDDGGDARAAWTGDIDGHGLTLRIRPVA